MNSQISFNNKELKAGQADVLAGRMVRVSAADRREDLYLAQSAAPAAGQAHRAGRGVSAGVHGRAAADGP